MDAYEWTVYSRTELDAAAASPDSDFRRYRDDFRRSIHDQDHYSPQEVLAALQFVMRWRDKIISITGNRPSSYNPTRPAECVKAWFSWASHGYAVWLIDQVPIARAAR